jgi:hypothetical protein
MVPNEFLNPKKKITISERTKTKYEERTVLNEFLNNRQKKNKVLLRISNQNKN